MIRLLLDGVAFQDGATSPATRLWAPLLRSLQLDGRLKLFLLDRGGLPPLTGAEPLPFARLTLNDLPADSEQVERICKCFGIDAFVSTGFTTPLSTPMLMFAQDFMPELAEFGECSAVKQERMIAFSYAQRYVCASDAIRDDLLAIYPEVPASHAAVAHPGIDHETFRVRDEAAIEEFLRAHQLPRNYLLYVPSDHAHRADHSWMRQVLRYLSLNDEFVLQICFADTDRPENRWNDGRSSNLVVSGDEELALAYNAALATIHWEPDSVFPFPLIRAMAAGCPNITLDGQTPLQGDLQNTLRITAPEHYLGGSAETAGKQLRSAAQSLRGGGSMREDLRRTGVAHASKFTWAACAQAVATNVISLVNEARRGDYDRFLAEWSRLRRIQANVDFPI